MAGRGSRTTARARQVRRVLAQWERSGLPLTEFARRHGMAASTLTWRRGVYRDAEAQPAATGDGEQRRGRHADCRRAAARWRWPRSTTSSIPGHAPKSPQAEVPVGQAMRSRGAADPTWAAERSPLPSRESVRFGRRAASLERHATVSPLCLDKLSPLVLRSAHCGGGSTGCGSEISLGTC
jgi:hypothetical protein